MVQPASRGDQDRDSGVVNERNFLRGKPLRQLTAACIGHTVESHDWYAYSFLSLYFADQIFPGKVGDPLVPLLDSFAVFAVAFAVRPVGAAIMGMVADRRGRRTALSASILLMGIGSLMLALVPSYATAGVAAPVLLVVARLTQGFSLGGEYAAAGTFLVESARPARRGMFSSFQYVASAAGSIMAGLIVLAAVHLTGHDMARWGWRLPFLLGAAVSAIGFWIRRGAAETYREEPARTDTVARRGMFSAVRAYPRSTLVLSGITIGGTVAYYTWITYLPVYANTHTGLAKDRAVLAGTLALVVFGLVQPIGGIVSDRVGRKPMLICFGLASTVLTIPLIRTVSDSFWSLFGIESAGLIITTAYTSVAAAVNAELFPPPMRVRGISLPYALTVTLFGGTAPYVGLWFTSAGHPGLFPWYVSTLCLISLAVSAILYRRPDKFSGQSAYTPSQPMVTGDPA